MKELINLSNLCNFQLFASNIAGNISHRKLQNCCVAKKLMSLAFFWKFQVFKREFLRNHLVYWAQISEITEIVMLLRGGSRIFFRRGCTRLLLYFNTNKPHIFSFFCRIPVILENRRSSQGGGGCAPSTPSP